MPTGTTTARDAILKKLLNMPKTRQKLGCSRYQLQMLMEQKLVKRLGEAKNQEGARKAVTYELTARGRKRAEKLGG